MTDENAEAAWREAAHRGLIARTQGDLARAIEAFSAALALKPDNSNLRFCRALGYFEIKDYPRAVTDFTLVI